eukprot:jgi/Chlat1/228/Chrsp1S03140
MAPQREGSVQSAASFCYGQSLLQQELQRITGDPPVGISVSPRDGNILIWDVTLIGVDGSVVDGGFLSLTIRFLRSFPHSAPRVRFLSRMYHPNITADGTPCLDMLSGEWNPLWSLTSLLVSLHVMLDDVDLSCPVNAEAARLYQTDRRAYTQVCCCRKWRRFGEDTTTMADAIHECAACEATVDGLTQYACMSA